MCISQTSAKKTGHNNVIAALLLHCFSVTVAHFIYYLHGNRLPLAHTKKRRQTPCGKITEDTADIEQKARKSRNNKNAKRQCPANKSYTGTARDAITEIAVVKTSVADAKQKTKDKKRDQ